MATDHKIEGSWNGKIFDRVLNVELPVDSHDACHTTALMYVTEEKPFDIVKKLIDAGTDIEAKDNDGKVPAYIAYRLGQTEVIELLIKFGANIEIKNDKWQTLFAEMCKEGKTKITNLLIQSGTNIEATASEGVTPLMSASR